MPTIRSAKKRMRQAAKRRTRNRVQRQSLRTAIKRVRTAETADEARRAYSHAERLLDRAAQRHLIHPRNAARQKQRLHAVVVSK